MPMEDLKPKLERQLDTLREPFSAFIGAQTTASAFLLFALVAALVAANSPLADALRGMQHLHLGIVLGDRTVEWTLLHLVNDGLIAVFFFLIGLEVKRELLVGELQDAQRRGLLLSAAIGGMVVPAAIYLSFNAWSANGDAAGWGIPMATDTALAIGVLAALADRVPRSVVAFLVGVAIVDDIGAILVIALVYTESLHAAALAVAAVLLVLLLLFNRAGFRHPLLYVLVGIALWVAIVRSGIHASIAGVVVAATVPARPRLAPQKVQGRVRSVVAGVDPATDHRAVLGDADVHRRIAELEHIAQSATTPLRRWENSLDLPVALLILPLFAFLNAGVAVDGSALRELTVDPVALGIIAGLVIGKPLGLYLGVRAGERLGVASRPPDLDDTRLLGAGMLAGVGFTMSTFIAYLALGSGSHALDAAKLAIVTASTVAAVAGYLMLRRCS